ncbi:MAG: sugar phosphate isomerase/epimerase [Lachnospiraceae bacterium]|nr:sugar phosphate isomerase/epimerase [Lachnospiraceae bacterium]
MRLGISSGLQYTTPQEWAAGLAALGCKSAIFPVDYRADRKEIDAFVTAAKEYDLVIGEVGVWCNPLSAEPEAARAAMERCVEQLKLADEIGAACCVNITGAAGERWDGAYAENFSPEFYERTVESIQRILDEAKPKRTFYTIEPMPWMVPSGPKEYAKLIADVNRAQFAVHMDLANWMNSYKRFFWQKEFIDEVFDTLGSQIKSCHIKDVNLRQEFTFQLQEVACGEGGLNLEYYVQRINEVNPDMPVFIEHLASDEAYRESFAYLQKRMKTAGLM